MPISSGGIARGVAFGVVVYNVHHIGLCLGVFERRSSESALRPSGLGVE